MGPNRKGKYIWPGIIMVSSAVELMYNLQGILMNKWIWEYGVEDFEFISGMWLEDWFDVKFKENCPRTESGNEPQGHYSNIVVEKV